MTQDLRDLQAAKGADFAAGLPLSFGNDAEAMQAAQTGVAIYDRTHWGRIEVSDADRIQFLHNQSTNDFKSLKPGQGCDTVFVTSTARTLDIATAYIREDSVLLLVSPGLTEKLMSFLDRYIFFADKVKLKDVTNETATFSLIGAQSHDLLKRLGAGAMVGQPCASHQSFKLADVEVLVAVGSGLVTEGYTLIADATQAASLWQALTEAGAVPLGDRPWQQLRILQGRPMPKQELTEDYNPLEAGLWHMVSLNKGCYIGQETIARLDTYQGVKQQLWGVNLSAPVEPGSAVMVGGDKVGVLTSVTETQRGYFGLVYVRTKAGGAGLRVTIEGNEGELVDVPFLVRDRLDRTKSS
jgi:tRNA-modifying protein YgfZ